MTIKAVAKSCSLAAMVLVVFIALGPANWTPRTALGWQFDHFAGYFTITLLVCFAWPSPVVVGVALMAFAALLEGLQAFTSDRSSNLVAAVCGAGQPKQIALFPEDRVAPALDCDVVSIRLSGSNSRPFSNDAPCIVNQRPRRINNHEPDYLLNQTTRCP